MGFRLVPNSVTLNDLERRNRPNSCVISPNSVAFWADCVSRSSITRMEQSASCCQRHAVTAVRVPSAFKDISVSIVIRLLTVNPVLSQRFSHR